MADKRIHNPDKSSSADVSRVSRSQTKMATIPINCKKKKKQLLCPVTVLVDSHVSDRCPWATCFISEPILKFFVAFFRTFGMQKDDKVILFLWCYKKDFEKCSF